MENGNPKKKIIFPALFKYQLCNSLIRAVQRTIRIYWLGTRKASAAQNFSSGRQLCIEQTHMIIPVPTRESDTSLRSWFDAFQGLERRAGEERRRHGISCEKDIYWGPRTPAYISQQHSMISPMCNQFYTVISSSLRWSSLYLHLCDTLNEWFFQAALL